MQNYYFKPGDDAWKLAKEHAQRSSETYPGMSKEEAVREAAKYVQEHGGGSLKILKQDGTLQEERTYPRRNDPPRSPG